MAEYRITKVIDEKFSGIYIVKNIETSKNYVIKYIDPLENDSHHEYNLHRSLKHQNIIRCYGRVELHMKYFILMEYAIKGDLYNYISKCDITENISREFMKDIINGVSYLHENNIVHRDLKLENILIMHDETLKICDFGHAIKLNPGNKTNERAGTLCYLSPEIFRKEYYSYSVDIWCLGIILFELLTLDVPFGATELGEKTIKRNVLHKNPAYIANVSKECNDLIKLLLEKDMGTRIDIIKLKKNPWLENEAV